MSVNPIDILRTQEMATIKHIESTRSQYAQEQGGKNFQTLIERNQNKPREAAKPDNQEYRYDAKEQGNNKYYGSGEKKKKKENGNKKESKLPIEKGRFDVRI